MSRPAVLRRTRARLDQVAGQVVTWGAAQLLAVADARLDRMRQRATQAAAAAHGPARGTTQAPRPRQGTDPTGATGPHAA